MIFSIGHSNRSLEEFIPMLWMNEITCLVDVRTMPRSEYNPLYNKDVLPEPLAEASIAYIHMPQLGGLRKPRPDSINQGWRHAGFRGYADYMLTPKFEAALQPLINLAGQERIVLMCAEALPWRCHRSLLADALTVRGIPVEHIMSQTSHKLHFLTSFAHAHGTTLTYPAL
ncbi:MAG TPA: DUF488 domain-containing protein [bacterium]